MKKALLQTFLCFLAPAAALAADANLNSVLKNMQAADPSHAVERFYDTCNQTRPVDQVLCAGYIRGVMDGMIMAGAADDKKTAHLLGICPPDSATPDAAIAIFKKWVQKHPEALGTERYIGVMFALQGTWACP